MYIYTCIHSHAYYRGAQEACWPTVYIHIMYRSAKATAVYIYIYIYYYIYITAGPRRPAGQPSTLYRQPSTLCQRVERAVSGSVLRGACDRVRSDFRRVHIHTHAAARTRARARAQHTHTHTCSARRGAGDRVRHISAKHYQHDVTESGAGCGRRTRCWVRHVRNQHHQFDVTESGAGGRRRTRPADVVDTAAAHM